MNDFRELPRQERRNRVSDLLVLFGAWANEKVVVRKGLKPGSLSDRETPALQRIRVNKVMAILGDMRCHCRGRFVFHLHTESVRKSKVVFLIGFPCVLVLGQQAIWKVSQQR